MRSASCFLSSPNRPDSPSRLSASLPFTCFSNWSSNSSENGPLGLRLRGFLGVGSVIHGPPWRHDDLTHKILDTPVLPSAGTPDRRPIPRQLGWQRSCTRDHTFTGL